MARNANTTLMNRVRSLVAELRQLDLDLRNFGDANAADAVKRARREMETVDRQGLFKARGEAM